MSNHFETRVNLAVSFIECADYEAIIAIVNRAKAELEQQKYTVVKAVSLDGNFAMEREMQFMEVIDDAGLLAAYDAFNRDICALEEAI